MNQKRPIVFLDRDGTINVDTGYVTDPNDIEIIPGAAQAIGKLRRAGFDVIVVTNQSAVGRGMAKVGDVNASNVELRKKLLELDDDAHINDILCSFDAPENASDERKPGIGLLKKLPEEISIVQEQCWMIGDKVSDVEFGINAGFPQKNCILVMTGQGKEQLDKLGKQERQGLVTSPSLQTAVDMILSA